MQESVTDMKAITTLSEKDFCQAVGISRVTCWRLRQTGKLPYLRIGSRIKYTQRIVELFLASCEWTTSQQNLTDNQHQI